MRSGRAGAPRGLRVAVGVEAERLGVAPHEDGERVEGEQDRHAEDHVGPAPAEPAHHDVGDRRQREGAEAAARAGQPDREAAAPREPLRHGGVARHVGGGHPERGHEAVAHVGLPQRAHAAHRDEPEAQQDAADRDDHARPPAIGEPARDEGEDRVGERVEREDPGEAGPAPAELVDEGGEEDAEGVLGAVGHEEDQEGARHHDPAVEETGPPRPIAGANDGHRRRAAPRIAPCPGWAAASRWARCSRCGRCG